MLSRCSAGDRHLGSSPPPGTGVLERHIRTTSIWASSQSLPSQLSILVHGSEHIAVFVHLGIIISCAFPQPGHGQTPAAPLCWDSWGWNYPKLLQMLCTSTISHKPSLAFLLLVLHGAQFMFRGRQPFTSPKPAVLWFTTLPNLQSSPDGTAHFPGEIAARFASIHKLPHILRPKSVGRRKLRFQLGKHGLKFRLS